MKQCFKCNIVKPLCDFYKHKQMADGHLNKCISCTKSDVKKRSAILLTDPIERVKEQQRGREKYKRLYSGIPVNQPKKKIAIANYKVNYPEKIIAKNQCSHLKPDIKGNQLHHWSYQIINAKDIIQLSKDDHYLAHRNMIYDQEFMCYRDLNNNLLDTKDLHISHLKSIGINI